MLGLVAVLVGLAEVFVVGSFFGGVVARLPGLGPWL